MLSSCTSFEDAKRDHSMSTFTCKLWFIAYLRCLRNQQLPKVIQFGNGDQCVCILHAIVYLLHGLMATPIIFVIMKSTVHSNVSTGSLFKFATVVACLALMALKYIKTTIYCHVTPLQQKLCQVPFLVPMKFFSEP